MNALDYARKLVAFETPSRVSNVEVTDYVESVLQETGFDTERIDYTDAGGVPKSNVVGKKGSGTGGMAWFGHTDVVPADDWKFTEHGPFEPTVKDDRLYGRGSCDMKGPVACALAAAARFDASTLKQPVYVTCTADEEIGYGGAEQVVQRSELYREMVDGRSRGIVGEPTQLEVVYAHKGCVGVRAVSHGKAAHSSTREGKNANLAMIPFLAKVRELYDELESDPRWQNDEFDPPTMTMNIGINDFTRAQNITAPQSVCTLYFRPMPGLDVDEILGRLRAAADEQGLEFQLPVNAKPLYTDPDAAIVRDVLELAGKDQAKTVSYGTDGAWFGELDSIVVYGPGSIAQAHTHDEWIALEQLESGTEAYAKLVEHWCC